MLLTNDRRKVAWTVHYSMARNICWRRDTEASYPGFHYQARTPPHQLARRRPLSDHSYICLAVAGTSWKILLSTSTTCSTSAAVL